MRLCLVLSLMLTLTGSLIASENQRASTEYEQSESFGQLYQHHIKQPLNEQQVRRLKQYRVYFVMGFLGAMMKQYGVITKLAINISGYFKQQVDYLQSLGIDAQWIPVQTQSGILKNAEIIKNYVNNSELPVILIGHSKGGIDILEALLRYPIQSKVKAFISIQSPFEGSYMADWAQLGHATNPLTKTILKAHGGSMQSIYDLSIKCRNLYMQMFNPRIDRKQLQKIYTDTCIYQTKQDRGNLAQRIIQTQKKYYTRRYKGVTHGKSSRKGPKLVTLHPVNALSDLLRRIPTINIGSSLDADYSGRLGFTHSIMAKHGYPESDGVCPSFSMYLQDAIQVSLEGSIDHATTIMRSSNKQFNRVAFVQAILSMALQQL